MPEVMEAIDRMSSEERVKTMEYLWAAMTADAEPESPAWHGDVLSERRRRVAAGEEKFVSLEEAMRISEKGQFRPQGEDARGGLLLADKSRIYAQVL